MGARKPKPPPDPLIAEVAGLRAEVAALRAELAADRGSLPPAAVARVAALSERYRVAVYLRAAGYLDAAEAIEADQHIAGLGRQDSNLD